MKIVITILRIAIGWHFLYEGISKILTIGWSAQNYLTDTNGMFSGFYHWLAASPLRMQVVDFMNMYGLVLIGLALFVGLFIRLASLSGVLLLILYYFAYPPFGVSLLTAWDGSLFIVDKIFIEACALIFIFFYKEKGYSIDSLILLFKSRKKEEKIQTEQTAETSHRHEGASLDRREALKNLVSIPVLGALGGGAWYTQKAYGIDATSGATIQLNRMSLNELKGDLPRGKIGNLNISRLIMGGNLITGYSHARDLIYVNSLLKAYNTERKIFETLSLAEKAGIDTISIGYSATPLVVKYREQTRSNIKILSQVGIPKDGDIFEYIDHAMDLGVDAVQIMGNLCDWCVRDNKLDILEKMMNRIRSRGFIAGLGAHTVDSLIICEEHGIIPDYYMKTMHHDNYWSAHPREFRQVFEVDGKMHLDHNRFHDNCFCLFPDRTIEFVSRAKVPVIGFKVLAAGAITPKDGFKWAFENGADFICVGMFDFQVVEDVNICIDTLDNLINRKREWFG